MLMFGFVELSCFCRPVISWLEISYKLTSYKWVKVLIVAAVNVIMSESWHVIKEISLLEEPESTNAAWVAFSLLILDLFVLQYYEMSYGLNVEMHKQVCC